METPLNFSATSHERGAQAAPQAEVVRDLRALRFRASPSYQLVCSDRLSEDEREALREFMGDPDFYGILKPTDTTGGTIKRAGPDTALLFLSLSEPGPVPRYLRARLQNDCDRMIAQLVLDGVLEMDIGQGFVSGVQAHEFLYADPPQELGEGLLARLSSAALGYAQSLPLTEPNQLAHKLYTYNALPASPRWRGKLPDEEAIKSFLGLQEASLTSLLQRNWHASESNPAKDGWFMWYSRTQQPPQEPSATYKLYLSPRPSDLPEALRRLIPVLAEQGAPAFKIGRTLHGLLRPDKLVVYFWQRAEMETVAQAILQALSGIPAQGVPFTAEVGGNGLLSWGMDPAQEKYRLAWQGPESWRQFITSRLARALVGAKRESDRALEPWRFALERVRLDGVDIATWTPLDSGGSASGATKPAAGAGARSRGKAAKRTGENPNQ